MNATDRTIVITGAGGGVGALLVERFLQNGDTVLATDNNRDALEKLDGAGDRLITHTADITSEDDTRELAQAAKDKTGSAHVLINCAGFFPIVPFEEISADDWRKVIDINLTGSFLMVQAFLPLLRRSTAAPSSTSARGRCSMAPRTTHYVAAKAGIVGFSRSLAREVGDYGITVNVITPGLTVTPAVRHHFPPDLLEAQRASRALQRDEAPEDLVGPVFFLASPDAAFITGQTLNVDGGRFMP